MITANEGRSRTRHDADDKIRWVTTGIIRLEADARIWHRVYKTIPYGPDARLRQVAYEKVTQ